MTCMVRQPEVEQRGGLRSDSSSTWGKYVCYIIWLSCVMLQAE